MEPHIERLLMIKPISISDFLLFTTVNIVTDTGSGTGFFFNYKHSSNPDIEFPVIVTNKHVINDTPTTSVNFKLRVSLNGSPSDSTILYTGILNWKFHPTHDLCVAPIWDILKGYKNQGTDIFFSYLLEEDIYSDTELHKLSAREEIVMVGHPIGLSDVQNTLPILRTGYTAAHPALDFKSNIAEPCSLGVVDCACFPGSSGSSIVIANEGMYAYKGERPQVGNRLKLIGILFGGPVHNENPINLGYYIKAKELLYFRNEVITS